MFEVKVIEKESRELNDLYNFEGSLYNQWLALWNSLNPDEKDLSTHPIWIISYIKSRTLLPGQHNLANIKFFFIYYDQSLRGVIPFHIKNVTDKLSNFCCLLSMQQSIGASLALKEQHYREVFDTLFNVPILDSRTPLMLGFSIVEENHPLLKSSFTKTVIKNKFKKYVLDTGNDYSGMLREKKYKKMRSNINRYTRRAQKLGDIEFEILQNLPDLFTAFEQFVDFEAQGWKSATNYAMKNNCITYNFYRSAINGFALQNNAIIFNLRAGDVLLSSKLCIKIGNTMYALKPVYDEKYSELSPGTLLTDQILKKFFSFNNIRYYNTVGPSEWFAKIWHPDTVETYKVNIFPDTAYGVILKQAYKIYQRMKPHGE